MSYRTNFVIYGFLFFLFPSLSGCGIGAGDSVQNNSNPQSLSPTGKLMTPKELARLQNQRMAKVTPENFDEMGENLGPEEAVLFLYGGLVNSDPAVRRKSQDTLDALVSYDDRYLEELKKVQSDNSQPDAWYATSLIIRNAESKKVASAEAQLKVWMPEEP